MHIKNKLCGILAVATLLSATMVVPCYASTNTDSAYSSSTNENARITAIIPVKNTGNIEAIIALLDEEGNELERITVEPGKEGTFTIKYNTLNLFKYKIKVMNTDAGRSHYDKRVYDIYVNTYLGEGFEWKYAVSAVFEGNDPERDGKAEEIAFYNYRNSSDGSKPDPKPPDDPKDPDPTDDPEDPPKPNDQVIPKPGDPDDEKEPTPTDTNKKDDPTVVPTPTNTTNPPSQTPSSTTVSPTPTKTTTPSKSSTPVAQTSNTKTSNKSPKTGDERKTAEFYIVLMSVSFVVLCFLIGNKRRLGDN